MPKKYGVKEKDLVVSHVVNLVLTGKLRSGDRLDRNEIAEQLGLSRVPVQEAVVQLEHDGVLSTRYHRGAFVERFDADSVLENHELYGVLNGIASARAAANPSPRLLHRLDVARRQAPHGQRTHASSTRPPGRTARPSTTSTPVPDCKPRSRRRGCWFRRRSGPPASTGRPNCCRPTPPRPPRSTPGTPDAARDACIGRAEVMGRLMLAELIRRRVLPPTASLRVSGVLRSE